MANIHENPFNKVNEVQALSIYLEGVAEASKSETATDRFERAAKWLEKLSRHMCGQGYIGCTGGPRCGSDHK